MLSQSASRVFKSALNGLRYIPLKRCLSQPCRTEPFKCTFLSSVLPKHQIASVRSLYSLFDFKHCFLYPIPSFLTTLSLCSIQIHQTKRIRPIRSLCTTSRPLSWDTFRQDALALGEKISTLVSESEGHLNRVMADALVSELLKLRKSHPLRHDELLSTVDLEENAPSMELGMSDEVSTKDPVVERYELLLMLAAESRDFKLVLELFDELQQRHISVSPLILNITMKSMLEGGDVSKGLFIFKSVESSSRESGSRSTDAITLFFAMQTYISLGDVEGMNSIYTRMGKLVSGSVPVRGDIVRRVVCAYIAGLTQIGRSRMAMDMYEQVNASNPEIVDLPIVHIAMIEAYSDSRQHAKVVSAFEKLAASDVRIPYTSVSRTIVSLLYLKKEKKAQAMYRTLEQSGLEGATSWQRFLDIVASPEGLPKPPHSSEDQGPLNLLRESPTLQRYEDAIAHFALAGDLVLAESLLNEYLSKHPGSRPTLKMVSSLFQGGARLGNNKYLALVANFQSNAKLPPSLARTVINFHIQRRDLQQAIEAFYKISTRYPGAIDAAMCESLLRLVLSGLPSSAASSESENGKTSSSKLSQQSIQTTPEHVEPTAAQSQRLQTGIDLYYHITSTFPDSLLTIDFFNAALTLFTKDTHPKGVSDTLEEIKKRTLKPNAGTYTSLMYLYLRRPDYNMVVQTYTQLVQKDLIPDVNTISALAIALGESKALANSKSVLFLKEQMDRYNIMPDSVFLEVLKRATTVAGNPNAFGVLMRFLVQKYQLRLSASNYTSWLAALLQCDQISRALALAKTVLDDARKNAQVLTHGFASQLALYVSKEGGSDLKEETVERWIADTSSLSKPLTVEQRVLFERDVIQWSKLFPDDSVPSM